MQEVIDATLRALALRLHAAFVPDDLVNGLRTTATQQAHAIAGPPSGSSAAQGNRINTINVSSWAKMKCYDIDFSLALGLPEAVRRPSFTPVESIAYYLPKERDGTAVVGLCLR